ncbi:hypothetical protein [Bradyrhizobium sp. RT3b]|uniref:hypothetical protein n=1 Tax=Bradyrhizobium sp. RT3b TaxID=3156334 RepID=UPI0033981D17
MARLLKAVANLFPFDLFTNELSGFPMPTTRLRIFFMFQKPMELNELQELFRRVHLGKGNEGVTTSQGVALHHFTAAPENMDPVFSEALQSVSRGIASPGQLSKHGLRARGWDSFHVTLL